MITCTHGNIWLMVCGSRVKFKSWLYLASDLDLPSHQHGVEACLYLENAPPSFGDKLRSQNDDETSALVHATGQVLNVGWTDRCNGKVIKQEEHCRTMFRRWCKEQTVVGVCILACSFLVWDEDKIKFLLRIYWQGLYSHCSQKFPGFFFLSLVSWDKLQCPLRPRSRTRQWKWMNK